MCLSRSAHLGLSVCVSPGQDTRTNTPTMSIMQYPLGCTYVSDVDNAISPGRHNRHRQRLLQKHIYFYQPSKNNVKHSISRANTVLQLLLPQASITPLAPSVRADLCFCVLCVLCFWMVFFFLLLLPFVSFAFSFVYRFLDSLLYLCSFICLCSFLPFHVFFCFLDGVFCFGFFMCFFAFWICVVTFACSCGVLFSAFYPFVFLLFGCVFFLLLFHVLLLCFWDVLFCFCLFKCVFLLFGFVVFAFAVSFAFFGLLDLSFVFAFCSCSLFCFLLFFCKTIRDMLSG